MLLTLTVDGVPCSALEGHVEFPPGPGGVDGDTGGKLSVVCDLLLTLTVDGVPCSALDGSVVPPPKRRREDEKEGQCPGSLVPYFVHLLAAEWY